MILDDIVEHKRRELLLIKEELPLHTLIAALESAPPPRDFSRALQQPHPSRNGQATIRIIAEIKKASPSKGILCRDFDPVSIARTYEACGAAAISVLTDRRFFQGDMEHLSQVRKGTAIPLLDKDFIVDSYQIYRARMYGADAVLLIAAILDCDELASSLRLVKTLGMSALVEVHSREELDMVLAADAAIIGINNRNLKTFEVSVDTTLHLLPAIPPGKTVVSESGINSRDVMHALAQQGVHAFLIGEALMKSQDREATLRALLS